MNQPYARVNQPYATLTLASALREMFGVQMYKNNARVLLSRILSILNLDWLQHARSVRGVYKCDSMKYDLMLHWITMDYAVPCMKMHCVRDCAISAYASFGYDHIHVYLLWNWLQLKEWHSCRNRLTTWLTSKLNYHILKGSWSDFQNEILQSVWRIITPKISFHLTPKQ